MKTATFVWFAGVLSFVSISEAILGRPNKIGDTGPPRRLYQLLTAPENMRQASKDLMKNYYVTAKIDDSKWQKFTTTIKESLTGFTYVVNEPNMRFNIGGVTNVEVRDSYMPIRSINVTSLAGGSHIVDLSLEIPKVSVTANAPCFWLRPQGSLPCTAVVMIDNLTFDFQAVWRKTKNLRISSAKIEKFDVGTIRLTVTTIGGGSSEILPKSSLFWNRAVDAVKTGLRNRGIDRRIVRDFVNDIVS